MRTAARQLSSTAAIAFATLSALLPNTGAAQSDATHFIESFGINEVNSAGGVEPFLTVVNPNRDSPIKYVHLTVTMYNAVGDPVRSTITRDSSARLRFTGPLSHGSPPAGGVWEPIGYASDTTCLLIRSVEVEFMNGRRQVFSGKTLARAISPGVTNDCRYKREGTKWPAPPANLFKSE